MVRPAVVQALMNGATDGMMVVAEESTGGEVLSAYMTLARNAMIYARDEGANKAALRRAVEYLWLELTEDTKH